MSSTICLRLHKDERGFLSITNLVLTLFLTIVLICLFNVGVALFDRTQSQQKADAVAQSLGNWKARNLNAVAAQQHLMGELFAMTIVHHAIGGEKLDSNQVGDTSDADQALRKAYQVARLSDKGTPAYKDIRLKVHAEAALLDGHLELKKLLTQVYWAKAIAIALKAYPITRPAGIALEEAAHLLELELHREWRVLREIYQIARSLSARKNEILDEIFPDAKRALERLIEDYKLRSQRELAGYLESQFDVKIHIMESDQRLPIRIDPLAKLTQVPAGWTPPTDCTCPSVPADNMRHQLAKVTQLARSSFPWVNYHRKPIVDAMKKKAPLSKIGEFYFDYAAGFSKRFADEYQREEKFAMYVLDDYEGPDKAMEPWTKSEGSDAADRSFGISAVVGTKTRKPIGDFFFRSMQATHTYRVATAMVWNRQKPIEPDHRIDLTCKRIVPSVQAQTGWDLLSWKKDAEVSELVGIGIPHQFPAIEIQWTSSLSPTSAARIKQLQTQPLPNWADELPSVLPDQPPADFTTL